MKSCPEKTRQRNAIRRVNAYDTKEPSVPIIPFHKIIKQIAILFIE